MLWKNTITFDDYNARFVNPRKMFVHAKNHDETRFKAYNNNNNNIITKYSGGHSVHVFHGSYTNSSIWFDYSYYY